MHLNATLRNCWRWCLKMVGLQHQFCTERQHCRQVSESSWGVGEVQQTVWLFVHLCANACWHMQNYIHNSKESLKQWFGWNIWKCSMSQRIWLQNASDVFVWFIDVDHARSEFCVWTQKRVVQEVTKWSLRSLQTFAFRRLDSQNVKGI